MVWMIKEMDVVREGRLQEFKWYFMDFAYIVRTFRASAAEALRITIGSGVC